MKALAPAGAALAVLTLCQAAQAQEDFRSADAGRPIRVEDARPLKFREWEVEIGSRGSFEEGARGLESVLELKVGVFRNAQFGLEIDGGLESPRGGGGTENGLEAASAHLLYGLRRETVSLPAVAVRLQGSTPGAGELGNQDAQLGVTAIATRSIGRFRVHGNGGYTLASADDGGDYWRVGLAGDYPVGLFSTAVLADVYAEIPAGAGSARTWVDAGVRRQITNRTVLDLGVSTRIDQWSDGNANVELVIGLSRILGLGGAAPPYPDPAIR